MACFFSGARPLSHEPVRSHHASVVDLPIAELEPMRSHRRLTRCAAALVFGCLSMPSKSGKQARSSRRAGPRGHPRFLLHTSRELPSLPLAGAGPFVAAACAAEPLPEHDGATARAASRWKRNARVVEPLVVELAVEAGARRPLLVPEGPARLTARDPGADRAVLEGEPFIGREHRRRAAVGCPHRGTRSAAASCCRRWKAFNPSTYSGLFASAIAFS